METSDYLLVILFFYGFLLFLDRFFKSCSMYPYIAFLNGTGLEINVLNINWKTTAFNRSLLKLRSKRKIFLSYWFDFGVYASLILLPIATLLLFYSLAQLFRSTSLKDKNLIVIEPVIPGVTWPIDELGYYVIALGLSSFVHEFGHAIAAVEEDVHIFQVGFRLYFVLPVAYVLLSNDQLLTIPIWKRLRILCAGIWHNLMFAVFSYLIVVSLPIICKYLYHVNTGVYVKDIALNSPLISSNSAVNSLELTDVIVKINGFPVINEETWTSSLLKSIKTAPSYCVDADFVHALDESDHIEHQNNGEIQCCANDKSQYLCFEYHGTTDGVVELPPHMCLPVRKIVEHSQTNCLDNSCPADKHCIRPIMKNLTSLIVINRLDKPPIIYIGHPGSIYRTVYVSSYVQKFNLLSPKLADRLELLVIYSFIFSLGLAILNVIPCWFLDGQHITIALVQLVLSSDSYSSMTKQVVSLSLTMVGSVMLTICIVGAVWVKVVN